jgi:hypothetical protein
MIRRLHGGEGSDAARFPLHLEAAEEPADQHLADEFRDLLERARGRAASATDEVSALTMALAAAQSAALTHQQAPVIHREAPAPDAPRESSEEHEESRVDEGDSPAKTADQPTQNEVHVQEERVFDDAEDAERDSFEDKQVDFVENPVETEETWELLEGNLIQAEPGVEEEVVPEEGFITEPEAQQQTTQQAMQQTDKAIQKEAADLTEKPFEVEVAPTVEAPREVRAELAPQQRVDTKEEVSTPQFDVASEELQSKPANSAAELTRASVALPKDATSNRAGDMSIQLAMLRQAFESARGFASSQLDAAPKRGMSSGQAVGAASEARSTRADMHDKAAKPLTRVQVHRMLEKVESAMKEAARSRDGKTIRFRVEPFNVGEVKVDVSLREGQLHARLKAENPQVTAVLRDRAHELQGALRKLGLDVDNVTVTVSEEYGAGAPAGEQNLSDGKSFQDERNNMPSKEAQVVENTFGNKIADVSEAGTSRVTNAILDHWVA